MVNVAGAVKWKQNSYRIRLTRITQDQKTYFKIQPKRLWFLEWRGYKIRRRYLFLQIERAKSFLNRNLLTEDIVLQIWKIWRSPRTKNNVKDESSY